MIKIDFEIQNEKYGVYRDALYLAEDHGMTDDQIEAMKQERYNNWVNVVENPPVDKTPQTPAPAPSINIGGAEYVLLEGTPASGAAVIEVNGVWYVKV
jgi:hypothetical protein